MKVDIGEGRMLVGVKRAGEFISLDQRLDELEANILGSRNARVQELERALGSLLVVASFWDGYDPQTRQACMDAAKRTLLGWPR